MENIGNLINRLGLPKIQLSGSDKVSHPDSADDECPICHGLGWVHPAKGQWGAIKRCVCKDAEDRRDRQYRLRKYCNLPARREHCTLDTFQTKNKEELMKALSLARSICEAGDDTVFLTLIGQSDVGKSHLAIGICREWLNREKAAHYVNVARMLNDLREGYAKDSERTFYYRLQFYSEVGLLVLDDFGTQKVSEWGAEQLQTVINNRYEDALHTVVTSNRPLDDLFNFTDNPKDTWREFANMRVASRLQRESWCHVVLLDVEAYMTEAD